MEFCKLTAREIADGVKKGDWTASEVVESHIDRIKKYDREINAVVTLCEEEAKAAAAEADKMIAEGVEPGPLCGVPFLVKDNFCADGVKTTCCSKMLENWVSNYDSTAVKLFKEAGGVLLGKTNMDEFAMGSTTESSIFGPTLNPHDLSRVPGGSSGGSAAAVAAGFCPIALGSDTGGSIRQPSAFCGVQGMKPSYGQVSRYGVIAYVSSLDQVGPIARDTGDIALAMDVLAKTDENDNTCDAYERPSFTGILGASDLKGKKIAVLKGFENDIIDVSVADAIDRTISVCKDAGAEVVEVSLPVSMKYGVASYYMIALGDASSKLSCYDGMRYGFHAEGKNLSEMYTESRSAGFGKEVRRRILIGTCVLTRGYYENYYVPATKVRRLIVEEFNSLFEKADALIMPISPSLPYKRGLVEEDPIKVYLGDAFSVLANLAGLPGITVNAGYTKEGLPVNVQFMGPRYGDADLIATAAAAERAFGSPKPVEFR